MIKQEYYYAKSVKNVDKSIWFTRWSNFSPSEIACKGTGEIFIYCAAMDKLQKLREMLEIPLWINSAYRNPVHNAKIGGSPNSQHIYGRAFDISCSKKYSLDDIAKAAKMVGFTGIGVYDTFVHVDLRPSEFTKWNNKTGE